MLAIDASRKLLEQGHLDLLELDRVGDVQHFLYLVQEHDLLGRIHLGPVLEQTHHDLLRQRRILFEELHDAVGELRVVQRKALHFMQRDQNPRQEGLMLLLKRERESVDDRSQDLEQLRDPIMPLGFVDEVEEDVINRPPDERAEVEEFAVDTVKGRFEEVALARVFRVKELEEVEHEGLVDVSFGEVRVEIGAFDEAEEEFIDDLEMRPGELEDGFVFFRVEGVAGRVDGRGY